MNRTAITGDLQLRFPVREEEHASSSPSRLLFRRSPVCARRRTSARRSADASSHTIVFFLMDKKQASHLIRTSPRHRAERQAPRGLGIRPRRSDPLI